MHCFKPKQKFSYVPTTSSTIPQQNTNSPVLVELINASDKNFILSATKSLRTSTEFVKVFINPDLNDAERSKMKILLQERKIKNNELQASGKLNLSFRYCIRSNAIVKIDVTKLTKQN